MSTSVTTHTEFVMITAMDDNLVENDETIQVTGQQDMFVSGQNTVTVHIMDNDGE